MNYSGNKVKEVADAAVNFGLGKIIGSVARTGIQTLPYAIGVWRIKHYSKQTTKNKTRLTKKIEHVNFTVNINLYKQTYVSGEHNPVINKLMQIKSIWVVLQTYS